MRVGSGVILFQLAGFLTSALADFYFAKHTQTSHIKNVAKILENSIDSTINQNQAAKIHPREA